MWRKWEGEGVDEMEMPCSVGSVMVDSLALTPLQVVVIGEMKRKETLRRKANI